MQLLKGRYPWLFPVALGLVSMALVWSYVAGRERELLQLTAARDVVVAARDMPPGTLIEPSMVALAQVPQAYRQPNAAARPDEVLGRMTAVGVPRGGQVTASVLADAAETSLALHIPPGRRAVTVSIDDVTGVGGMVRPGDYVDVLGVFEFGRPIGIEGGVVRYADERTEVRTLLQSVQALAIGRRAIGAAIPSAAGEPDDSASPAEPRELRTATLLLTPEETQRVVLAQHIGDLTLALRAASDSAVGDLPMLDPLALLNVAIPPKPKVRRAPGYTVTRGYY